MREGGKADCVEDILSLNRCSFALSRTHLAFNTSRCQILQNQPVSGDEGRPGWFSSVYVRGFFPRLVEFVWHPDPHYVSKINTDKHAECLGDMSSSSHLK